MALLRKTSSRIFLVVVVLLGSAAADVRAQGAVNKCIGPDGKVTLTQVKCPNDRAATSAEIAANAQVFNELRSEISDIVVKYGRWRDRLLKLWAGAPPGSLGLLDTIPPLR